MTDDNERPESNPSRESRPGGLDKGVVDDVETDVDTAGEGGAAAGEVTAEGEGAVDDVEATIARDGDDGLADEQVVEVDDVGPSDDAVVVDDVASESSEETVEDPSATELETDAAAGAGQAAEDESRAPDAVTAEEETPAAAEAEAVETEAAESVETTVTAPGVEAAPGDQRSDTFTWHPEHRGKSFDEVRAALAQDIAADQRQHRLAMEGAEESEQEALASVVGLERKWGKYDFDWAEQEPDALADRIVDFERERERRHQMISWSDYRDGDVEIDEALAAGERPAELSSSAKGLSLLLVVLLIVVILLAVWAL